MSKDLREKNLVESEVSEAVRSKIGLLVGDWLKTMTRLSRRG